jgi:hypothetical protein
MLRTIEVQVPGLEAVPAIGPIARAKAFLDRIDPATHRRIKGLRLVTAYGIAALLGTLLGSSYGIRIARCWLPWPAVSLCGPVFLRAKRRGLCPPAILVYFPQLAC